MTTPNADAVAALGPLAPLRKRHVARLWWPLAASWLMMGLEGPAVVAVVARLADPEVHLAAYGGLVFPLALFIEAPIIMLLAASTAMSRDLPSYRRLRRYTHVLCGALTAVHALVAFTPLYHLIARGLIGVPEAIVAPGRLGLMILLPWTWAIGYRRFNQGLLIRLGRSLSVGIGTVFRLGGVFAALAVGYRLGLPGIAVGAAATAAGVLGEALFVGLRVRPLVRRELPAAAGGEELNLRSFLSFYLPLSLTPLIFLLSRPIGSAAISRMPEALDSLAVWPAVTGLVFLVRSAGMAYNEVVVASLARPGAYRPLRAFAWGLAGITTAILFALAATPLGRLWLERVSGLSPHLADLGRWGLWLALPLPALTVVQNWLQGIVVHTRRTRAITEAVVAFLIANVAVLAAGVAGGSVTALYVALAGMTVGEVVRTAWLALRSRAGRAELGVSELGVRSCNHTSPICHNARERANTWA